MHVLTDTSFQICNAFSKESLCCCCCTEKRFLNWLKVCSPIVRFCVRASSVWLASAPTSTEPTLHFYVFEPLIRPPKTERLASGPQDFVCQWSNICRLVSLVTTQNFTLSVGFSKMYSILLNNTMEKELLSRTRSKLIYISTVNSSHSFFCFVCFVLIIFARGCCCKRLLNGPSSQISFFSKKLVACHCRLR